MAESDPLIGTELGAYRLDAAIGRGGMGAVYRATELAFSRTVALKVLLPEFVDDAAARQRFQREIDLAVMTEHPHIVPVYSAGFEPPHFYIAMRYVPGSDLHRICRESGRLSEDRALRLLGQVGSALYAVHLRGLVHRDIKPHNVLIWGADDDEHAMLTDFGIAKALGDTRGLTGMGALGTPAYMAPELWLGGSASAESDQYALACMVFELLAGRPPFAGTNMSPRDAHVESTPPSLREVIPATGRALSDAVALALSKNPADRHADVRAFIRAAAPKAGASFERSENLSRSLEGAVRPEDAAQAMLAHELSDATISHLTDLDRTEIVRLRRTRARRALVGRDPGSEASAPGG